MPTTSSGDARKASGVDLDKAPPPPPSLSGPTNQMDGILGQGQDAQGMPGLEDNIQTAMQVEMGIQKLAGQLPGFAPIAPQVINLLRLGVAQGLKSVQGSTAVPQPGAGMPNSPQPLQGGNQPPQASGAVQ